MIYEVGGAGRKAICRIKNIKWLGGHVKKKNAERQVRWVQVEALCLCARLERERISMMNLSLEFLDYPPCVIAEAKRLGIGLGRRGVFSRLGRWLSAVLMFPIWGVVEPVRACCLFLACFALRQR
jgi:hypothetical protein